MTAVWSCSLIAGSVLTTENGKTCYKAARSQRTEMVSVDETALLYLQIFSSVWEPMMSHLKAIRVVPWELQLDLVSSYQLF